MYSKLNSRGDYVTLLECLEHLTTKLREEMWRKRQRQEKREKEMRFNRGPAHVPPQPFPNVATRSRSATSVDDLSSLTHRSHLRPGLFPSEEAKPSSISYRKPITIDRPKIANRQSERVIIDHENGTLSVEARPATIDIGMPARDILKQAIERKKNLFGENLHCQWQ